MPNLADLTRCQKRAAQILVANPDDMSYAAADTTQGKYAPQDITDALLQADIEICRTIQEVVGHGFRTQYGSMIASNIYGKTLQGHPGKLGSVEIQLASTAWESGVLAEDLNVVRKVHLNPDSMYGGVTENEGLYYIAEDLKLYYIGQDARVFIPTDLLITAALQAPATYEPTVVRGGISLLLKDPTDPNLATYKADYNRDIQLIQASAAAVPALDISTKSGG